VKEGESDEIDGRYSPPAVIKGRIMDVGTIGMPTTMKKEKPPLTGYHGYFFFLISKKIK